jgi:ketose-bisphosphate aldolase
MLTTNLEMLQKARAGKFAIPAINTQGGCYDIIWACCKAAQEMRSPMILAHYVATGAYSGNDFFFEVAKWCANKVDVPVSIHLDHGENFEICEEAFKLGFTSIMIDGSKMPVSENAKLTGRVIERAKEFKVPVEAEIGELLRIDEAGSAMENKNIADPQQVKEFLSLCNPDTLAIGIGNAHGYYKGEPNIRLDILGAVADFAKMPLVLHGCTGMKQEIIREAITLGVAKINFGTEIRYKYLQYYKEGIDTLDHQGHSWKVSKFANNKLCDDIKAIIELSGSQNKV